MKMAFITMFLAVTAFAQGKPILSGNASTSASSDLSSSHASLQRRVSTLEDRLNQLQRRVIELERNGQSSNAGLGQSSGSSNGGGPNWTTCIIETPFDGTFTATEPTHTAALAGALRACNEKTNSSISCSKDKANCGK